MTALYESISSMQLTLLRGLGCGSILSSGRLRVLTPSAAKALARRWLFRLALGSTAAHRSLRLSVLVNRKIRICLSRPGEQVFATLDTQPLPGAEIQRRFRLGGQQ